MYVPKPETASWEPLPQIGPWRALTDEEYAAAQAALDELHPDQPGSLSRWFDRAPDTDAPAKARSRGNAADAAGGQ